MSQPPPSRSTPPDDVLVDARGRRCPLPVIDLARALPTVAVGAVVLVVADDPAAAVDIPAWCRMRGQEYLGPGPDHETEAAETAETSEIAGTGPVATYRVRRRI